MVKVLQHVGSSGSGGRGGWWVTPLLLQSPCQNILDHSVGVCVNVRQGVYRKVPVVHVWTNEDCSKMYFEFSG